MDLSPSEPKENQLLQFEAIRRELKKIVLDQNDAIDEVVDAFSHMAFRPPKEAEPKAIFTFLGPPGVGKIYLARVLCNMLKEYKGFKHFDLERYSDPESGDLLLGPQIADPEIPEGDLLRFLRATPRAIILFEAIEMASSQLQMALLDLITKEEPENVSTAARWFSSSPLPSAAPFTRARSFRPPAAAARPRPRA